MTKVLATPGVYVEEKSGFSSSVVAVQTAVPAFVGFTEKAIRGRKSLINKPTRISSLGDFETLFGGAPKTTFAISEDAELGYKLEVDKPTLFYLHRAMRLFYTNGGGPCYIVSVGTYEDGLDAAKFNDLSNEGGIPTLLKEPEPTMLVIPDAVLLDKAECYGLQQAMIKHCGYDTATRIAILDIYDGTKERTFDEDDIINQFREGIGSNHLAYCSSYYPWLHTTAVSSSEVNFKAISNLDGLQAVLNKEVDDALAADFINEKRAGLIKAEIEKISTAEGDGIKNLQNTLAVVSLTFKSVMEDIQKELNLLPPSAAMAGVYSMVDNASGVHIAPANVSLGSVIEPAVNLTNENQEDLNLPLNGKAVNAIRAFRGRGTLVWGARTMDGNSQDWRYINVRRAVIMIEQSVKNAAEAYVFAPNISATWVAVNAMITNFLNNMWQGGVLAGSTPEDAFTVEVGLGSTMTSVDILDGVMRVSVKVAITRPAEFIVITFQQQMQKS